MLCRGSRISALAAFILINSTAMGNHGRLIAPGNLRDELAAVDEDAPAAGESLAEMAAQYGLRPSSARPRLVSYLVKVWQRRHFILAYATARNVSMYTEARLGQLWQVLTPLLNSAVYYLIFGGSFQGELEVDDRAYELLLGAVVQVTGDSLPGRVECGDHALTGGDQLRAGGLETAVPIRSAKLARRSSVPAGSGWGLVVVTIRAPQALSSTMTGAPTPDLMPSSRMRAASRPGMSW
jgi:hypothetical protein